MSVTALKIFHEKGIVIMGAGPILVTYFNFNPGMDT